MKIEAECKKRFYEPTGYGIKYKTYGDTSETIVVHLRKTDIKAQNIPDNFKITIEWDEDIKPGT